MNNFYQKISKFVNSVHFKIALIFSLTTFLTLGVTGIIFLNQVKSQNIASFKKQIRVPKEIKTQFVTELQNTNMAQANSQINSTVVTILGLTSNDTVLVIDSKGTIRGGNTVMAKQSVGNNYKNIILNESINNNIANALSPNKKFVEQQQVTLDNRRTLMYASPLMIKNGNRSSTIGAVIYYSNMQPVYDGISNITNTFLGALFVPFITAILLSYLISRWFTAPLTKINKQAQSITDGNFSVVNSIKSNDEIGELAQTMNNLTKSVSDETESSKLERNRLDSLLENMTDGVLSVDRKGRVMVANPSAQDLLDDTEIEGTQIEELLDLKSNDLTYRKLLENENTIINSIDSTRPTIRISSNLVRRSSGFVSGSVLVIRDVTAEVAQENQQKDFVSNVSHELRTPLTSVNSYIETLQDGAMDNKKIAKQFLEVAHQESQRMIRMINNLLELSRIDQKNIKFELEFVNIYQFIDHILSRFNVIVDNNNESKKFTLKKQYKKGEIFVEIDTDRFTQVIDNVINNAIKYSPDGGKINIGIEQKNSNVIISITDEGLGIPKSDLKNIFNRFYRVDKARARKQGGSGLGLAISKEVVEGLHGKIWVESKINQGTTFFISMPIADDLEDF